MSEFYSPDGPLPHIPDDLTVAQFILDSNHPLRAVRPHGSPWLIDDVSGRKIEYEELRVRTHGLANGIHRKFKFGEGDIACIFTPNHVDYPVAIWAVHRLGGVVSTANPAYNADELDHQLTIAKTRLLFAHSAVIDTALAAAEKAGLPADHVILLDNLPNSISGSRISLQDLVDDGLTHDASFVERKLDPGEAKKKLAFLCFSSGTTGKPKAVAIAHYSIVANVFQQAVAARIWDPKISLNDKRYRPGDITTGILPIFHIYGLICNIHFSLFAAMSVVVTSKFNFEDFLKSIVRHRITHLMIVPPMMVLMAKHPVVKNYDFSHVRGCFSGAAPLSVELVKQLVPILPNAAIGQGYGMTETATVVSFMPLSRTLSNGSVGVLAPGVIARVVKQDGTLAKVGETGELRVTGPSMAMGYLNNEKATKETFVDGWVHTGDEVRFDSEGNLYIVDRLKELIKVRGFQVAPAELEGHLLGHPAVADVCVVPVPDDYSGEVPLAYVVLRDPKIKMDSTQGQKMKDILFKYVADSKTKYKWLNGGVEFIDEIPKTASGKMLRRVLREQARKIKSNQTSAKL